MSDENGTSAGNANEQTNKVEKSEQGRLKSFHDTAKKVTIISAIITFFLVILLSQYLVEFNSTLVSSLTSYFYYTDLTSYSTSVSICGAFTVVCASVASISAFFWIASNLLLAYKNDRD